MKKLTSSHIHVGLQNSCTNVLSFSMPSKMVLMQFPWIIPQWWELWHYHASYQTKLLMQRFIPPLLLWPLPPLITLSCVFLSLFTSYRPTMTSQILFVQSCLELRRPQAMTEVFLPYILHSDLTHTMIPSQNTAPSTHIAAACRPA